MSPNIRSITNPAVRQFYALYWPHHQIILDFYERLAEEQYDVRIVETPQRKPTARVRAWRTSCTCSLST